MWIWFTFSFCQRSFPCRFVLFKFLVHHRTYRSQSSCWAAVLIIRIPCIFNVLKANQLFPFHSPFLVHSLSRTIQSTIFLYAAGMEKNLVSDSSGVSLLASMFIADDAARAGDVRVRAHTDWWKQRENEADERRWAERKVRQRYEHSPLHHRNVYLSA